MEAEGVQSADTGEPLAICRFSCSFHPHLIAQSLRGNLPVSGQPMAPEH